MGIAINSSHEILPVKAVPLELKHYRQVDFEKFSRFMDFLNQRFVTI